ncbi:MAG: twin-arginine translocation signal domain-containing protein [Candidatus Aenigmarchaeota archaeon]|nr:twin-arginine translocation signal domain-containing protein [Candidatus Aenigmarchaeota archaeon]
MEFTRRDFLKLVGAGVAASGLAYLVFWPEKRQGKYDTAEGIADYFRGKGIDPTVRVNGDRTLVCIGEIHSESGDEYVKFFDKAGQDVKIDAIFGEGELAGRRSWQDIGEYVEEDFHLVGFANGIQDPAEIEERKRRVAEDPQGYFRLSRKFNIFGVEDRDPYVDTLVLLNIQETSMRLKLKPSDKEVRDALDKIKRLAAKLKTIEFEVPETEDQDVWKFFHDNIYKRANDSTDRIALHQRNSIFADNIDRELAPEQVGAFIVGQHHVGLGRTTEFGPDGVSLVDVKLEDTMLPLLDQKGISYVVISLDDVIKFNKRGYFW